MPKPTAAVGGGGGKKPPPIYTNPKFTPPRIHVELLTARSRGAFDEANRNEKESEKAVKDVTAQSGLLSYMGGGGGAPRKRRPMFDKSFYLPNEYKSPDFLHFSRRVAGDQALSPAPALQRVNSFFSSTKPLKQVPTPLNRSMDLLGRKKVTIEVLAEEYWTEAAARTTPVHIPASYATASPRPATSPMRVQGMGGALRAPSWHRKPPRSARSSAMSTPMAVAEFNTPRSRSSSTASYSRRPRSSRASRRSAASRKSTARKRLELVAEPGDAAQAEALALAPEEAGSEAWTPTVRSSRRPGSAPGTSRSRWSAATPSSRRPTTSSGRRTPGRRRGNMTDRTAVSGAPLRDMAMASQAKLSAFEVQLQRDSVRLIKRVETARTLQHSNPHMPKGWSNVVWSSKGYRRIKTKKNSRSMEAAKAARRGARRKDMAIHRGPDIAPYDPGRARKRWPTMVVERKLGRTATDLVGLGGSVSMAYAEGEEGEEEQEERPPSPRPQDDNLLQGVDDVVQVPDQLSVSTSDSEAGD